MRRFLADAFPNLNRIAIDALADRALDDLLIPTSGAPTGALGVLGDRGMLAFPLPLPPQTAA
jgi:hypothetical protein